jgi:UDP-2,3-diacylglucosamine pyrophosphatase LpxH
MKLRKYYSTIVLSDIHLGFAYSRTEEVTRFLQHVNCDRLILNGDIIDGWLAVEERRKTVEAEAYGVFRDADEDDGKQPRLETNS